MSIVQVARRANVSTSTVSRYLHGTLNVEDSTAQRIDEAAHFYKYTTKINSKTTYKALALVIPGLNNPFYSELCQQLSMAADGLGYALNIKISQGNPIKERNIVESIIKEQKYIGLIYAGLNNNNIALRKVIPSGMNAVLIDEQMNDEKLSNISTVTVDNYSGAYQAVCYLLSLGHKRIAYVSGPDGLSTTSDRKHGYLSALTNSKILYDDSLIFSGPYTEEFGESIFPYIVSNPDPPTAIFCSSDISALGLLGAAERYGLKIPDDLSVIGCDGIHIGKWAHPSLTTLQQPFEAIAKSTLELISFNGETKHIQLPLTLTIRNSTCRIKN